MMASLLLLSLVLTLSVADDTRPLNVLFVFAEDLGLQLRTFAPTADDVLAESPNLAALAARNGSVVFERTYAVSATCSPSRAALLTGLYPHQMGHYGLSGDKTEHAWRIRSGVNNLFKLLKTRRDYRTMTTYKVHVNSEDDDDIKRYIDEYQRMSDVDVRDFDALADSVVRFARDAVRRARPYFALVSLLDSHRIQESGNFLDQFKGVPDDDALLRADDVPARPSFAANGFERVAGFRDNVAAYANSAQRVDAAVGRLLRALERDRAATDMANTLVIVAADHGPSFARGKLTLYELGVRVPLLVNWPATARAARRSRRLTTLLDVTETIVDAAGLAASEQWRQRRQAADGDDSELERRCAAKSRERCLRSSRCAFVDAEQACHAAARVDVGYDEAVELKCAAKASDVKCRRSSDCVLLDDGTCHSREYVAASEAGATTTTATTTTVVATTAVTSTTTTASAAFDVAIERKCQLKESDAKCRRSSKCVLLDDGSCHSREYVDAAGVATTTTTTTEAAAPATTTSSGAAATTTLPPYSAATEEKCRSKATPRKCEWSSACVLVDGACHSRAYAAGNAPPPPPPPPSPPPRDVRVGRSLRAAVRDGADDDDAVAHVFFEFFAHGQGCCMPAFGVRAARYKLIYNVYADAVRDAGHGCPLQYRGTDGFQRYVSELRASSDAAQLLTRLEHPDAYELYDLVDDPWETRNLASLSAYSRTLDDLADALFDWRRDTGDPLLVRSFRQYFYPRCGL